MLRHCAFIAAFAATPLLAQEPGQVQIPGARNLTIGGQYRLRYEAFFDYDLNSDAGASTDFFGQRARLDFGFDFADNLNAFVQFQDARLWGEEMGLMDPSADGFDVHQAYVDIGCNPCFGGSTRVGRMEVNLGAERLVGAYDWSTQARALDGVLQTWGFSENGTLHAFVFQAGETISAPEVNDDVYFGGLWYARKFGDGVDGNFYFLHLHDDGATVGNTANISTIGALFDVKATDAISIDAELAFQFGEAGNVDISSGDAYAGHLGVNWNIGGDRHMMATAAIDFAAGDDPATTDYEGFTNLFPSGHKHWGMMDLASWHNLINPWIRFQFDTCEKSNLAITAMMLMAMDEGDSFGGPNGMLSMGGADDDMGNEIDVVWTRSIDWGNPNINSAIQLGLGLFLPGDGAKNGVGAGSDDMAEFFYAQFNLDF